jgi:hypothetical protein
MNATQSGALFAVLVVAFMAGTVIYAIFFSKQNTNSEESESKTQDKSDEVKSEFYSDVNNAEVSVSNWLTVEVGNTKYRLTEIQSNGKPQVEVRRLTKNAGFVPVETLPGFTICEALRQKYSPS